MSLRREIVWLRRLWRDIDTQAAVVLTLSVVLMFVQLEYGTRRFFRTTFPEWYALPNGELLAWAWWFGTQGVTGFVLPVVVLLLVFRQRPADIGLGLGDWKLAALLAGLYTPLVVVGTWVLSNGADFQDMYPHFDAAEQSWRLFAAYHALYVFYWMGWEYLWRGFVLFGTARALGPLAIFVQMVPFALLHADKPAAEAYLSILGGVALAALCWRCRSFWIAVPLHAVQMLFLDLFCVLRARTGADGIGFDALWHALGGMGG